MVIKKKAALLLAAFILIPAVLTADASAKHSLSPAHKKWLEEEAVYIITPVEKEVFLALDTDRLRDHFIRAFWNHRDPTPGTPENEFKEEHYRRLLYAKNYLRGGAAKPGWRTDRGRIYIILGKPNDIQRFEGRSDTYPIEIWWYQGLSYPGLPAAFNLVFFQERGVGEYRLYSPLQDGPQKLLAVWEGDRADTISAYQKLLRIDPELARVSFSLIPGEENTGMMRPSVSSDLLIQNIETMPEKRQKDVYANKFLRFKDIVEVEYSANYIDSDSLIWVIKDSSGTDFIHYAVELPRLSVNSYENEYYFRLKINGTLTDLNDRIIYQYEKTVTHSFDSSQLEELSRRPFNLHDMFPVAPGSYKLSILIKNEVSKEFTSVEKDLSVSGAGREILRMSSLMLGYSISDDTPAGNKLRPFQPGKKRLLCQPNRVFSSKENLITAFQVTGISPDLENSGLFKFTIYKEDEEFRTRTQSLNEYPDLPNVYEKFSLRDFPPAYYKIRVSLMDGEKEVLSGFGEFSITFQDTIARPWIHSRLLPEIENPVYDYILGTQHLNAGRIEEARDDLETAYSKSPQTLAYGYQLARLLQMTSEFNRIKSILTAYLERQDSKLEVYFLLGRAHRSLGEWDKAINVFNQALTRFGVNIFVLNAIGDCYFQSGNKKEALAAWEKSLEINAGQPEIRKKAEEIRKVR